MNTMGLLGPGVHHVAGVGAGNVDLNFVLYSYKLLTKIGPRIMINDTIPDGSGSMISMMYP